MHHAPFVNLDDLFWLVTTQELNNDVVQMISLFFFFFTPQLFRNNVHKVLFLIVHSFIFQHRFAAVKCDFLFIYFFQIRCCSMIILTMLWLLEMATVAVSRGLLTAWCLACLTLIPKTEIAMINLELISSEKQLLERWRHVLMDLPTWASFTAS